ncbi:MAG: arsenate reductase/protein-tyrosine-phosphatase family protein [Leptospirales bacterium]
MSESPSPGYLMKVKLKKFWYGLWGSAERMESIRRLERLSGSVRILVVCYGNICRSPLVELLLRGLLPVDRFEIRSCGLLPREGATPPKHYVQEAHRFGVDLSGHRSRYISKEMVEWSNLIIIMDRQNLDLLKDYGAAGIEKSVWLGAWDLEGGLEIPDPFDRSPEEMRTIIDRMKRASLNLALCLKNPANHPAGRF